VAVAGRFRHIFKWSRWAIGAAVLFGALSMFLYPGGTVLDPNATGYSFFQNFISDLGMTVTHGGQANSLGAALFIASFGAVVLASVGCAAGFIRLLGSSSRGRGFARAGATGALLAAACLLGAALAPANRALVWHIWFSRTATMCAIPSLVLFAVATARDGRFPAGVSIAWMVLTVALGAWFAMRWGPGVETEAGLTIQASVQKAVALILVGTVTYQTYQFGARSSR